MPDINMQQARAAVDAAREKSERLGVKMNIAIVDSGTNLKAFARMDDAWLGSIDIAIRKARTARSVVPGRRSMKKIFNYYFFNGQGRPLWQR